MIYSRRDFGKIAVAGLPFSAAFAAAKIDSKVAGVQLGCISYSFRDRPLDAAIKSMAEIGIGYCELFAGHVEPSGRPPGAKVPPAGPPQSGKPPQGAPGAGGQGGAQRKGAGGFRQDPAVREALRKWRLTVPLAEFKAIRKKFDDAGIKLIAYNLSFNESFTDEEIDRGFQMAKALGVNLITASATVKAAQKVAPFADKHKIRVAMHNHANLEDPNQFARPESFAAACAMSKNFGINLDIGHFVAANYDPIDYLRKEYKRIMVLHIKDRKKNQGENTPWGQGDTPIKEALQLVRKNKWNIPCIVEYEYRGEQDAVVEVKKCFQYMKDALA